MFAAESWSLRSIFDFQMSIFDLIRIPIENRKSKIENLLPFFRRLAGHHFLGRYLHRALRRLLDDPDQAMVLGLAQRPALGQFHPVALARFVLLIMSMENGAALEVLAVLGVVGLVVDCALD